MCIIKIQPFGNMTYIMQVLRLPPGHLSQIIQIIQIIDHTDHIDHTDQEPICPERSRSWSAGIDHTDHLSNVCKVWTERKRKQWCHSVEGFPYSRVQCSLKQNTTNTYIWSKGTFFHFVGSPRYSEREEGHILIVSTCLRVYVPVFFV